MSRPTWKMVLPTASQLISPLIAWARIHGKIKSDIVARKGEEPRPGIQESRYRQVVQAEGNNGKWNEDVGLKWHEIPTIAEVCGLDSIDMLLHVAQADEMADLYIPANQFRASLYTPERRHIGVDGEADLEPQPADADGNQELKTSEQLAKDTGEAYRMRLPLDWEPSGEQDLYGHRTIIEKVVLRPGTSTRMDQHLGWESVLLISGTVEFEVDKRSKLLNEGDFFSFNSQQSHLATNRGNVDAILAVARMMGSEKIQADLNACDKQYKNASKYYMETATRRQIRNLIAHSDHRPDSESEPVEEPG